MRELIMENFVMCIYPFLRELYHTAYEQGLKNKGRHSIGETEQTWLKIKKALKDWGYWKLIKSYNKTHKL